MHTLHAPPPPPHLHTYTWPHSPSLSLCRLWDHQMPLPLLRPCHTTETVCGVANAHWKHSVLEKYVYHRALPVTRSPKEDLYLVLASMSLMPCTFTSNCATFCCLTLSISLRNLHSRSAALIDAWTLLRSSEDLKSVQATPNLILQGWDPSSLSSGKAPVSQRNFLAAMHKRRGRWTVCWEMHAFWWQ